MLWGNMGSNDGSKVAFAGLAIVVAQLSTNLGAALGKGLFPLVGPEGVAALRTGISALILLAISRPWRIALTKRQTTFLALYGLALGSMNLLIYLAIERLPIGVAIAIEISGPLSVVLLTSRSIRDFFWFALAVASLLMLMPWPGSQARLDSLGIAFAFCAAGCWALYILFGKRASELGSKTAVALGMVTACAVTLPFGIVMAGEKLLVSSVLWLGLVVALLSSGNPLHTGNEGAGEAQQPHVRGHHQQRARHRRARWLSHFRRTADPGSVVGCGNNDLGECRLHPHRSTGGDHSPH
jgi:inner membrane transporter RhtA